MKQLEAPGVCRIIGIGNRYRSDDGVGPRAIDLLRNKRLSLVELYEAGDDLTGLIQTWSKNDSVICIDAVQSDSDVGRIHRLNLLSDKLDNISLRFSTHSFDPVQVARLATQLNLEPSKFYLYGIEADNFSWGEELTPEVQKSMKKVVDEIVLYCNLEIS
ncbi:MAG: hydrogenase maturation protease [Leptospirales bacterium]